MRISIGQIIILTLLLFLLFGDLQTIKKKLLSSLKKVNNFFQK